MEKRTDRLTYKSPHGGYGYSHDLDMYDPEIKDYIGSLEDKATATAVGRMATKLGDYTCPKCMNVVGWTEEFNGERCLVTHAFCRICGQHLDWGELQ